MSTKILIVDDRADDRELIAEFLESEGYEILVAADGDEGVAVARSELPDLILIDIRMPKLDGCEATRQLKSIHATRSIPVIAWTTGNRDEEWQRALAAGCTDFITKPVTDLDQFARTIADHLESGG